MTLDAEQRIAASCLSGRRNAYLTGSAGTGKTTVILHHIGVALERVHVTASTGVAAINLRDKFAALTGGLTLPVSTIYRWAGIKLGPDEGQAFADYWDFLHRRPTHSALAAWRRIKHFDGATLVIDEVSMLPGRLLDYFDYHCRRIRGIDAAFGGIHVIAVGDFLQLPPVAKDGNYDWAFASEAWKAADFRPLVLTNVHRQNDGDFTNLLNRARVGEINGRHRSMLDARIARFPAASILRLFTHNAQVDKWNAYQLGTIESEEKHFEAVFSAEADEFERRQLISAVLAPVVLKLKRGARVMLVSNIVVEGELIAVNGSLGTVEGWGEDFIGHPPEWGPVINVELDDGIRLAIGRHKWNLDHQDEESAWVSQIPLRLAWASTIHKAQGLTLDSALIDLRATREPGQTYVALSRVRTIEGLHLRDTFSGLYVSPKAVRFQQSLPALPQREEAFQLTQ